MHLQNLSKLCCSLALASLLVAGCSDDEPGTITEEWSSYCTATFADDYQVIDGFDDSLFAIRAGEEYLLLEYEESDGELEASLAYLTKRGPYAFDIKTDPANPTLPFTTECEIGNVANYIGAFDDVTFYASEELSQELCTISAGTVLPRNNEPAGFSIAGGISFGGPQIYRVYLNAFAAQCGASEGFVKVPEISVLGTQTNLVPVRWFVGPTQ
ncbi:MAG: hypothetical protein JKY56_17425 [Kofleriaceae bacterium]|nr:hypothetical protein [Kofleriaceae bacterium]